MRIETKPGDGFVRHAEPVDLFQDKARGTMEWFLSFQLDGQTLYVGLKDVDSLKRLGVLVARALKEVGKGT